MRRLVVDLQSASPTMSLPATAAERLRGQTPEGWEVVFVSAPTDSRGDGTATVSPETRQAVATAEAYFGYGVPAALVRAAPRLRWAHSASAGVGGAITPELVAAGVQLTNSAGVYGVPMAESVLAGVLHFLRGFDLAVRQQAERLWSQDGFHAPAFRLREVAELRVLVIGTGGVGQAVARRLSALGAHCTGVRRRPELGVPDGFATVTGPDGVDAALSQADAVVLAAPLTASSQQLLDARRLALLPRDAIVVNVARGGLLDEVALLSALDAGRLRGAYLDVFPEEPLPAGSPLWSNRRVLISPHVSGLSPAGYWGRALALFEDNWQRYVAGAALRNVVDLAAGY